MVSKIPHEADELLWLGIRSNAVNAVRYGDKGHFVLRLPLADFYILPLLLQKSTSVTIQRVQ